MEGEGLGGNLEPSGEGEACERHSGRTNTIFKVGMRENTRIMDKAILSRQSWSGE